MIGSAAPHVRVAGGGGRSAGDRLAVALARHVVPEGLVVAGAPPVPRRPWVAVGRVVAVVTAAALPVAVVAHRAAQPRRHRQRLDAGADQRRAQGRLVEEQRTAARAVAGRGGTGTAPPGGRVGT